MYAPVMSNLYIVCMFVKFGVFENHIRLTKSAICYITRTYRYELINEAINMFRHCITLGATFLVHTSDRAGQKHGSCVPIS